VSMSELPEAATKVGVEEEVARAAAAAKADGRGTRLSAGVSVRGGSTRA